METFGFLNNRWLLFIILFLELAVLVVLLIAIGIRHVWILYKNKKTARDKEIISQIVVDCIEEKNKIANAKGLAKFANQEILLSMLEAFNHRFNGESWEKVRDEAARLYLLDKARKWSKSIFWIRRNYAARCFALSPQSPDQETILHLIDDPIFLVSGSAAAAGIKLEMHQAVMKILQHMSSKSGYARFFYRDLLLKSKSLTIFKWIEDSAYHENEIDLHLICLDLLAEESMTITHPFLHKYLSSPHPSIRIAALKVFACNPQRESFEILMEHVKDPEEEIRSLAVLGLGYFSNENTIQILREALRDNSSKVRLEAAKALKRWGRMGQEILKSQNPSESKEAYDTAQYVLQLDWY